MDQLEGRNILKKIVESLFHKKPRIFFTYGTQKKTLLDEMELIDLSSHTVEENRRKWNEFNWSKRGDQWTKDVKKFKGIEPEIWKANLINRMMLKYIKKNSNILEIGSGAGRWSEYLIKLAKNLILTDIAEKCLEICKERFKLIEKIDYKLIQKDLKFLGGNSVDYIWSYDVFVHINPTDIKKYIKEFSRILVGGGCAIIHHTGKYSDLEEMKKSWRTYMNAEIFAKMVRNHGMEIIEQNDELVHKPGDIISVFIKPKS